MFNCSANFNSTNYAGIVDFGMSLISNRKQNEHFALGGTEPYTHPTQDDREYKEERCQPGQDWFAAARTMAHLLAGGSTSSFKSLLGKDQGRELLQDVDEIYEVFQQNAEVCKPVLELIDFSLKPESKHASQLYQLMIMGENAVKSLKENIIPEWPQNYGKHSFQTAINQRPKRHDVLLIIDNTGSMAPHVQQVKDALDEIAELVHGRIDLRVDLWSLGDYSSGEKGQKAVIPLGKRMRPDTFQQSLNQMDANREQNDEAEAYEVALQLAYLEHPKEIWTPRKSTTRSIVLVGDAYAHGWIEKYSPWGTIVSQARGKYNQTTGYREEPNQSIKQLYDDFCRRHPHYMTVEIQNSERDAYKKAFNQIGRHDQKTKKEGERHVYVEGEVFPQRPNYRKAIQKCVEQKKATIHTIGSGSNLVSSSFMKYVALQGNGTYTHVGGGSGSGLGNDGELIIALKGIFASVDAKIFRDLEKETLEQNPNTQALNSITTFVIDSMSDDN